MSYFNLPTSMYTGWPDWAIYWTLGNFSQHLATINLHKFNLPTSMYITFQSSPDRVLDFWNAILWGNSDQYLLPILLTFLPSFKWFFSSMTDSFLSHPLSLSLFFFFFLSFSLFLSLSLSSSAFRHKSLFQCLIIFSMTHAFNDFSLSDQIAIDI